MYNLELHPAMAKTSDNKKTIEKRFKKQTYKIAIKFFVLFTVIAIASAFGGNYLDKQFSGGKPVFSFMFLLIGYAISWTYVLYVHKEYKTKIDKSKKKIEE